MRLLGFLITLLGLFELFSAAPDREKRQTAGTNIVDQCRAIFNVSCTDLSSIPVSTPPPLKTDLNRNTDGSDCECVEYYQCYSNGTRNTDGATIIDRRISPCRGILEVCCKPALIVPGTPTSTATPTGNTGTPTGSTGTPTDGTGTGVTPTPLPQPRPTFTPIPIKPGCGHRNPDGISVRITGTTDNEAQFAEFPWMVAVLKKAATPNSQAQYLCGGSLIHPSVILTAAHNVERLRASDFIVRAGEWDTQINTEPLPHQEREVQAVIMHERYNTNNLHSDFALLILKTPFDVAPNVNTICLPQASDSFDAVRCVATGWGKDKFEQAGKFQAVLKRIVLPIVPHAPCQDNLRNTRLGNAFVLDPSFICAGGEPGLDTCTGDGGSPLACPLASDPNRYVQSGIVAWGISCGGDRTPGVYANVAQARQWIDSKMAQYNFDTSTYSQ